MLVYLKGVLKTVKIFVLALLPLLVFIFLAGNIFAQEEPYEDIEEAVGGLPASKLHSAALVIGALRAALAQYAQATA